MEIRFEETNGVKRYFVNDKEYERLEDVPQEFRSFFTNPDVFGAGSLKSFLNPFKAEKLLKDQVEQNNPSINQLERSSALSGVVKMALGALIIFIIAWSVYYYLHHQ
jgi:hypothetical protein